MNFRSMSLGSNFVRFVLVFFVVLVILLLALAKKANAQEIMPLSEIKKGDRGYGFTIFRGTQPEKFDFEVRGLYVEGPNTYIAVLLSGGPADVDGQEFIKMAKVVSGMSGSPLYIKDRIIGALSAAWIEQQTPQAKITPIEYMTGFKPIDLANVFVEGGNVGGNVSSLTNQIRAGETYVACEAWDDNRYCAGYFGNITYLDPMRPGLFYSLGHSATRIGATGLIGLPFWKGEVVTIIPSFSSSKMLVNKIGPALGSIVFNGPFGQIGQMGVMPKFIPVTITLNDGLGLSLRFNYQFAYSSNVYSNLTEIINRRSRLFDRSFDVEEEVYIDSVKFNQVYYRSVMERVADIDSSSRVPVSGVEPMVKSLLSDEFKPTIQSIWVALNALPRQEILKIQNLETEVGKNGSVGYVALSGVGEKEWVMKIPVDKKYFGKKLSVSSGREIANNILTSGELLNEDSIEFLNKISDWNAVYLYYAPEGERVSADRGQAVGGWQARQYKSHRDVLAKIDPPVGRYRLEGNLSFTISIKDEKSARKKRLGIF